MSKNQIKLGGIWKNTSESGKTYYSGNITKYLRILILKNDFKNTGDNQPDFNVYLADNLKADTLASTEADSEDEL